MRPLIRYFGGKWKLSKWIGPPKHNVIVEPFAGGAGYSTYWDIAKAILIEKDPLIANLWRFLIEATHDDIMDIPLIASIDEMEPCVQRDLACMWFGRGDTKPRRKISKSMIKWQETGIALNTTWGHVIRERIADNIHRINNWEIIQGSYRDAPIDSNCHYHIDPPYQHQGVSYTCGSNDIDYADLADFVHELEGHGIVGEVCEGKGADWLDFELLIKRGGQSPIGGQKEERIYRLNDEDAMQMLFNVM